MGAETRMPKGAMTPVSVSELRDRLASGALDALTLVESCIARIEEREEEVGAWAWFDPDFARAQARTLDTYRRAGRPLGRLHGLPVGLKDVIDTQRIPTEN
ncbi:amidase family protein, partial [Sulfitobacter sp. HI0023]|uniref:amidase family protein n=6 Tax=Sulfitobacter TaxID=60136 RepID=UPI000AD8C462